MTGFTAGLVSTALVDGWFTLHLTLTVLADHLSSTVLVDTAFSGNLVATDLVDGWFR